MRLAFSISPVARRNSSNFSPRKPEAKMPDLSRLGSEFLVYELMDYVVKSDALRARRIYDLVVPHIMGEPENAGHFRLLAQGLVRECRANLMDYVCAWDLPSMEHIHVLRFREGWNV